MTGGYISVIIPIKQIGIITNEIFRRAKMIFDLANDKVKQHILQAEFGLERESLRVIVDGTLAQTKHPFPGHRNIDRDFCENQIEIIGDVFNEPEPMNAQLNRLQDEIDSQLIKDGEVLWAFSNPPKISGEDEIPVAEFGGSQRGKSEYRNYLAAKYGKKKMLFSGIHLNFSFAEPLLRASFEQSGEQDFQEYKNDLYLKLARRLTQYAWLVVYLTAASPVLDESFGVESGKYSSVRCSELGYWNTFTPILDYTSLKNYIVSIARYIESGKLKAASELYYPVRVKPRGANSLEALLQNGINHIELRVLDVNPLTRAGIFAEDIRFIHVLLLYLSSLPDFDFDKETQTAAIADIKKAPVFGSAEYKLRAKEELAKIKTFTECYLPEYISVVERQLEKLSDGGSYPEIISREFGGDYMNKGLALARKYQRGESDV